MLLPKKLINKEFLILFIGSIINLLVTHYHFLWTNGLEIPWYTTSAIDNLLACLLDTTILLTLLWLVTWKRTRISLGLTFAITLIWSFCNVFYARFFHQYLSWSSIGQAGNLTDSIVIDSMVAGFKPIDLYYPLAAVLFCWLYARSRRKDLRYRSLRTLFWIWIITLCMTLAAHSMYFFHPSTGFIQEFRKTVFTPAQMDSMWPNWTFFHKGFFRKMAIEPLTRGGHLKLTPQQEAEIEREYTDHSQRVTRRTAPSHIKNVIFILVESYLACTSDLEVDGQEITPNLNRLRHDSCTYYNGHMRPNVSIGESSDGQLIYMAGLLPLHSEITVSKARSIRLFGLPEQLRKSLSSLQSYTIIPTSPSLWDQQAMTKAYGFNHLYSTIEFQSEIGLKADEGFMNDELVFLYASKKDEQNTPPFMSLILTLSMHMPYNSQIEHGFHLTDKSLPQKYKNYLVNCHYTDMQIGKYVEELKKRGLYDNSLIVIAADHDAHPDYLDMEGKITSEIPIYIIHGGMNNDNSWTGACNQLDVYTTILDVMGINCQWHGLGHTLLNKHYQNSVTDKTQELSDWIIYGNYFDKKELQ